MDERYSDSTLMAMTKAELIEQIRCAEHNEDVANERLNQHAENVKDWEPVRRGRWEEHYENEDGYCHHRCTTCKSDAPFDYKYTEDWDEGIDGEWFSLGFIVDGVNEHITPYCPNCGAKMYADTP